MKNVLAALQFFPFVMQAVTAVETAMGSASGADKKTAVLSAVQSVVKIGETVPVPIVSMISQMIDGVVNVLNSSGVFTHKTPATVIK